MTTVKIIGRNNCNQFGIQDPSLNSLVDGAINNLSTKIEQIIAGVDFTIYCEEKYKNVWTAGANYSGQCATNTFAKVKHVEFDAFHPILFFKNKGINIKKICTNVNARTVFWITESGQVYGNGRNEGYNLGIRYDRSSKCSPVLIHGLKNVIDIQCNFWYSIALCSNKSPNMFLIIEYWTRSASSKMKIPQDVICIILKYYNICKVLSVGGSGYGGHGHGGLRYVKTWTEIEALRKKNITKIRVGGESTYCLDSEGIVWVFGRNDRGQLGLGHNEVAVKQATCIEYFIKNDIKIKEIEVGCAQVITMDYNNCVWIFGDNRNGKIVDVLDEIINVPVEMIMFRDFIVEEIKSGQHHVYLKCNGDQHYFWGNNLYNQCLAEGNFVITTPHLLNLKQIEIKHVFLGSFYTMVIVSKHEGNDIL